MNGKDYITKAAFGQLLLKGCKALRLAYIETMPVEGVSLYIAPDFKRGFMSEARNITKGKIGNARFE